MRYIDKYNLWNVKPVGEDREPTGNDGLIISAYAHKVGLLNNPALVWKFYMMELKHKDGLPVERLPNKPTPPPSRDFFLAASYFGMVKLGGWNFSPYPIPKFDLIAAIKQFWALRGKHRNTFWENPGYEQVFRFAFSVPLQDRAFYYRMKNQRAPLFYRWIEVIDSILRSKSDSSKLIAWLKYDKRPELEVFERYFGKDHPIYKAIVDEQI